MTLKVGHDLKIIRGGISGLMNRKIVSIEKKSTVCFIVDIRLVTFRWELHLLTSGLKIISTKEKIK
jgi:hypothetical protein